MTASQLQTAEGSMQSLDRLPSDFRSTLSAALIESLSAEPSGFNGQGQAEPFLRAQLERFPYYKRLGLSQEHLLILMLDLFDQIQHAFHVLGLGPEALKRHVEQLRRDEPAPNRDWS